MFVPNFFTGTSLRYLEVIKAKLRSSFFAISRLDILCLSFRSALALSTSTQDGWTIIFQIQWERGWRTYWISTYSNTYLGLSLNFFCFYIFLPRKNYAPSTIWSTILIYWSTSAFLRSTISWPTLYLFENTLTCPILSLLHTISALCSLLFFNFCYLLISGPYLLRVPEIVGPPPYLAKQTLSWWL